MRPNELLDQRPPGRSDAPERGGGACAQVAPLGESTGVSRADVPIGRGVNGDRLEERAHSRVVVIARAERVLALAEGRPVSGACCEVSGSGGATAVVVPHTTSILPRWRGTKGRHGGRGSYRGPVEPAAAGKIVGLIANTSRV